MPRLKANIIESRPVVEFLCGRFAEESFVEGADGKYLAIFEKSDGSWWHQSPYGYLPDRDQLKFAHDLIKLGNRELHHDGMWCLVFSNPGEYSIKYATHVFNRFAIVFVDADGDPGFTIEWEYGSGDEFDFQDVLISGLVSWVERMEGSWEQWHTLMKKVIAPKEGQTYKRAQGQRPKSRWLNRGQTERRDEAQRRCVVHA